MAIVPWPVLVPRPFAGALDYLPPASAGPGELAAGRIVRVPLGRGESFGCIWDDAGEVAQTLPPDLIPDRHEEENKGRKITLRRMAELRLDIPLLPPSLRRFIDWVAAYTLTPPGMVLAMAIRAPLQASARTQLGWLRAEPLPEDLRLTPQRRAVLEAASLQHPMTTAMLIERAGVGAGVVRGLAASGALKQAVVHPEESGLFPAPQPDFAPPVLSAQQQDAADVLTAALKEPAADTAKPAPVILLEGVTGSGKTEVYFEGVAEALRQGRQVLVLLPEIALTTQWRERFARRFGAEAAVWHSELGARRRRDVWCGVAEGQVQVVVGPRSALFLPFSNLGLVVVDEEHESVYKQEEGVTYHGRDMAVVRGRQAGAPVILASATPSMETRANAEHGRYGHVVLPARHGGARLPETALVDMRRDGPERGEFLSPVLSAAVDRALEAGEQAMLFLNRRGYAPLTLCRACGHRFECPNCSAWMVEHRKRGVLACHHCDHVEPVPTQCPGCGAEHALVPIGPGIERIREEAEKRFPQARLLCMASDTLDSPAAMAEAVHKVASGEVNLVIGTQMVAKGWDFPDLTLVGVVDADLGLGGGDLRAAERTMQLLHQVGGRAGRGTRPGRVLLQSYAGEHPVMQALLKNDFNGFMAQEAALRQPGFWPPFGRLAAVIVSAPQERVAEEQARLLAASAPRGPGVQVLGPAPAPLALLRGRWRQRLLLRTRRGIALQPLLRQWLGARWSGTYGLGVQGGEGGVKIEVDVDPVSFL
ncbi:primosomal protein N' [Oecophyllibacter saccharovorans]|uniref:primosomal protein N' n=1 Tax=Oecophyllibacter saccharovorans TaxID=2558360 RepID=UPI0038B34208